ncbi:MAG: hypothetical protein HYT61_02840 [Candidatus Yanofskybacteria bacterium]|nr:hypothetical protein [Candidatus Yanofskybacteria bacterium]
MFLQIAENSAATTDYQKYLLSKVLKHSSKRSKKPVELRVAEESTPYPEIEIINEDNISHEELVARMTKGGEHWLQFFPNSNLEGKTFPITKDDINRVKKDLVITYTRKLLDGLCQIEVAEIGPNSEFGTIFYLEAKNPAGLKEKAKMLGVEFNNPKELREKLNNTPSEFLDNPPRIRWGSFEIEIPAGKKQFAFCKEAFGFGPGEVISWDIMAEKMGTDLADDPKHGRQLIYDLMHMVNDKIKDKTKKDLFIWAELAFYRKH